MAIAILLGITLGKKMILSVAIIQAKTSGHTYHSQHVSGYGIDMSSVVVVSTKDFFFLVAAQGAFSELHPQSGQQIH